MSHPKQSQTLLIKGMFREWDAALKWVFHAIPALPVEIRPTRYGEGECRSKAKGNRLADEHAFEAFARKSKIGFWLYGEGFSIDLQANTGSASEIVFWASESDPRFLKSGEAVLRSFAQWNAVYGFAAAWSEYLARNGYFFKYADRGSSEGFCGRDHTRYLPGLYWLNFCSGPYLERHLFDFAAIARSLGRELTAVSDGKLLALYPTPTEWASHDEQVCRVIDEADGVFSIRDIVIPPG